MSLHDANRSERRQSMNPVMWCGLIAMATLISVTAMQGAAMIPATDHDGRAALFISSTVAIMALGALGVWRECLGIES